MLKIIRSKEVSQIEMVAESKSKKWR